MQIFVSYTVLVSLKQSIDFFLVIDSHLLTIWLFGLWSRVFTPCKPSRERDREGEEERASRERGKEWGNFFKEARFRCLWWYHCSWHRV